MLKNLTTRDAVVINVFNHTVMQGEKGVTATAEIPSIDGEKQTNSSGRFRNENATAVTMARTDLNLA